MKRQSTGGTASAVLTGALIVLVPLVAYVGGYMWLGEFTEQSEPAMEMNSSGRLRPVTVTSFRRIYDYRWQSTLFWPAGQVEALARGYHVEIVCTRDW